MLARTQLLRVQKDLYFKLKDCAKQFFGGLSPEMRRYYREYQRDFSTYSSFSIHTELVTTLESAQVAICGDYHTLSQAQRTVIRLTRDILPTLRNQKRKLIIALELASPAHDSLLRSFVAGRTCEKALRDGLDFGKNWGFPWENYRPLFRFAQMHQIELVGISPPPRRRRPSLQERDHYAAKVIADLGERDPFAMVFALIGDLHLASSHLPKELRVEYTRRGLVRDTVVIHQNNETLYWELAELGLDNKVDIVKIREGVFCLFNTPPWVKLQSHLKWAELLSTPTEEESEIEPEKKSWSDALVEIDHVEEVKGILDTICDFIRVKPRGIEGGFSVHGPEDRPQILATIEQWGFTPTTAQILEWYLEAFQSLFIPRANYLCLKTPSMNHEARLAAIYLHSQLSGFQSLYRLPEEDFYRFTLVEALGFIGSKILNPRRKSRSIDEMYHYLADKRGSSQGPPDGRAVALLSVQHWEAERLGQTLPRRHHRGGPSYRSRLLVSYKTAKVLGKALGEAIYRAVIDGKIDRDSLAELFRMPLHKMSSRDCLELYCQWGTRVDRLGYRLAKPKAEAKPDVKKAIRARRFHRRPIRRGP